MDVKSKEGKGYKAFPDSGLKLRWDVGQKPVIPYRVNGETIELLDRSENVVKQVVINSQSLKWILFNEEAHEFLILHPDKFSHFIAKDDYADSLF